MAHYQIIKKVTPKGGTAVASNPLYGYGRARMKEACIEAAYAHFGHRELRFINSDHIVSAEDRAGTLVRYDIIRYYPSRG